MATTRFSADDRLYEELAGDELLDHLTYEALARRQGDSENRKLLERFAAQEREHFEFWARLAGKQPADFKASRVRLYGLLLLSRVLGFAFTIRRLERGEEETLARYEKILSQGLLEAAESARLAEILEEERAHEREVERRLSDERVTYLGSAVLGLNDALVELTGGLTGLVSSISDPLVIGFSGLVVGLAASMSMAASNFLSVGMSGQPEAEGRRPAKSALYTGVASSSWCWRPYSLLGRGAPNRPGRHVGDCRRDHRRFLLLLLRSARGLLSEALSADAGPGPGRCRHHLCDRQNHQQLARHIRLILAGTDNAYQLAPAALSA